MLFKNQEQIINNGKTPELKKIRRDILDIYSAAINSVDPYNTVKSKFVNDKIIINSDVNELSNYKNIYLIGFGKASIGMAQAVCDSINIKSGAIITNDSNNKVNSGTISTLIGNHPIPNQKSIDSTEKILEIVKKCSERDLLIVLC